LNVLEFTLAVALARRMVTVRHMQVQAALEHEGAFLQMYEVEQTRLYCGW